MSKVKTELLDVMPENVRKAVVKEVTDLLKEEGWNNPNIELTEEDIKRWSKRNETQK